MHPVDPQYYGTPVRQLNFSRCRGYGCLWEKKNFLVDERAFSCYPCAGHSLRPPRRVGKIHGEAKKGSICMTYVFSKPNRTFLSASFSSSPATLFERQMPQHSRDRLQEDSNIIFKPASNFTLGLFTTPIPVSTALYIIYAGPALPLG